MRPCAWGNQCMYALDERFIKIAPEWKVWCMVFVSRTSTSCNQVESSNWQIKPQRPLRPSIIMSSFIFHICILCFCVCVCFCIILRDLRPASIIHNIDTAVSVFQRWVFVGSVSSYHQNSCIIFHFGLEIWMKNANLYEHLPTDWPSLHFYIILGPIISTQVHSNSSNLSLSVPSSSRLCVNRIAHTSLDGNASQSQRRSVGSLSWRDNLCLTTL